MSDYPSDALLEQLRTLQDGMACLDLAADYFNQYNPDSAWRCGDEYKFATVGWSGCEDVIEALMANGFVNIMWESHHRGGLWVFDMSRAIEIKQDASAAGAEEE